MTRQFTRHDYWRLMAFDKAKRLSLKSIDPGPTVRLAERRLRADLGTGRDCPAGVPPAWWENEWQKLEAEERRGWHSHLCPSCDEVFDHVYSAAACGEPFGTDTLLCKRCTEALEEDSDA